MKINERLRSQLEYVRQSVPFYRDNRVCDSSSLDSFPLINKKNILSEYSNFISEDLGIRKNKLVKLLENPTVRQGDSFNEVYEFDNIIIEQTTGTSGIPFRCAKTKSERSAISLEMWKTRRKIDKQLTIQNLFSFNHTGINRENPNPNDFNLDHVINLYKKVEFSKSRWLHASPNTIEKHVDILKNHRDKLSLSDLHYIEFTGNHYSDETKKKIENFFNVKIVNQYGCIETWAMAMSCNKGHLHVNETLVHIELLDDNDKIINQLDQPGRVFVTSLINKAFPIIRYQTGDFAKFVDTECSCNQKGPVIQILEGREINLIKGLSNKVFGNVLFHKILQRTIFEIPAGKNIKYIQITQPTLNSFLIEINEFKDVNKVVQEIINLTKERLNKDFLFEIKILSENMIYKRRTEKGHLFLCKC
ncbi:hypothetical protein [Enterococcus ureasiticus]|uniref:AMP-dependent synthetase/ligase domain-containing protein n=1 Tax=Enterococcus ureasiticus TaxID=903984 RepID=A0A1E5GCC4_9ENTE|nr:hypothetical protein [Enterococcus ureasiticus]OEG10354.1 hypothetical protein BCR21_13480 [Enterococcus ureasiticus]